MKIYGNNLDLLTNYSAKSFQLILTDPPYEMEPALKIQYHNEFRRLCCGTIAVFMPPENPWVLPASQYLFWEKPISTKNTSRRYSRFVEEIFLYEMDHHKWNCHRHWSQYTNVFRDLVDESKHPHRKPPSMIERIILNHTDPGDLILDPFAGSFVVHDVSERLGRVCTAIEIKGSG